MLPKLARRRASSPSSAGKFRFYSLLQVLQSNERAENAVDESGVAHSVPGAAVDVLVTRCR